MKPNDFNKVALVYDLLARVVFGNQIVNSQKYFLNRIPNGSKILILGGGTGEILPHIFNIKSEVCICYIDSSEKMIARAKRRVNSSNQIQFIHGTEHDIPCVEQFDVVITNFYFDLFSEESLRIVVQKIQKSVTQKAIWIVTDFVDDNYWQRSLLKMMYLFFSVTCHIEANNLPAWQDAMTELGGKEIESNFFYGKFIKSVVFQF